MKITVDVDCTPLEARQFMGLPDVEPMQKAAMAEIEKRMMAELERFSPETLFKAWLPIAGMNADWLQEFFKRASPKPDGRSRPAPKSSVFRVPRSRFALPYLARRLLHSVKLRKRGNPIVWAGWRRFGALVGAEGVRQ